MSFYETEKQVVSLSLFREKKQSCPSPVAPSFASTSLRASNDVIKRRSRCQGLCEALGDLWSVRTIWAPPDQLFTNITS